jgi:hypothetical protein
MAPMIEIDVADAAMTAAAEMAHRAVVAEMAAAVVVWWDEGEKELVGIDVVWYGDWMREWEAMAAGLGGGGCETKGSRDGFRDSGDGGGHGSDYGG